MANAGQACVAVERVYVAADVADQFVGHVRARVETLHTGSGGHVSYGPITMPSQLDVIVRHVTAAVDDGGELLIGGADSIQPPYVHPVVIANVPEESTAMTEETFGPVLIINTVESVDEAIERANATEMGLGTTVFAHKNATRIASSMRAGMVAINSVMPFVAMPALPFGGVGASGFGRIHGEEGLKEFVRTKAIARQVAPPTLRVLSFDKPQWTTNALVRLAKLLYGR